MSALRGKRLRTLLIDKSRQKVMAVSSNADGASEGCQRRAKIPSCCDRVTGLCSLENHCMGRKTSCCLPGDDQAYFTDGHHAMTIELNRATESLRKRIMSITRIEISFKGSNAL